MPRRYRPLAAALLTATLLILTPDLASAHDRAVSGGQHDEDADRLAAIEAFEPGQTIGWLLATGEVGWGVIAAAGDGALVTESGLVLDQTNCQALWRPDRSRARTVGKGAGYGLALGALASAALYANYHDDASSGLANFAVGLGIGAALAGGLVGGTLVGALAPETGYWRLVYRADGADTSQVDRLPRTSGAPRPFWPRAPWVEITPALGTSGWHGKDLIENQDNLRLAVWWPVSARVDVGGAVGYTETSTLPGSSDLSASFLVRIGGRTGNIQPYLVTGLGWYGPLGEKAGLAFGGGLRIQIARRWALSLETGAVSALSELEGDRPGMARLGIGIAHSLGTVPRSP